MDGTVRRYWMKFHPVKHVRVRGTVRIWAYPKNAHRAECCGRVDVLPVAKWSTSSRWIN
jgi:hypothetical protein